MAVQSDIGAVQFENANALRDFPFAAGSSLTDKSGKKLPDNVIVDVHMVVPAPIQNPSSGIDDSVFPVVRLTGVHLSKAMISACFISECAGVRTALSVMVAASDFRPYVPFRLEKIDGSDDIGGVVTFGDMELPSFPENYLLDEAVIQPCCISAARPAPLRGFFDPRSGERISGDADIEFSGYIESVKIGRSFTLSLASGADAELESDCSNTGGYETCGATPIRSINGVRPDENGNIVLWFH